jgi:ABC-2 type transport system ATP-binding protein
LLLGDLESVGQLTINNNTIRIRTRDLDATIRAVIRFAENRELKVVSLNTVKPSLEEAFVELTGVGSEHMMMEKEKGRGRR